MDKKTTVRLQCPTCGSTDFKSDGDAPEAPVKCTTCNRETTRTQLIEENAANIEFHKQALVKEVTGELKKELQRTLRSAFRGSKIIKVK